MFRVFWKKNYFLGLHGNFKIRCTVFKKLMWAQSLYKNKIMSSVSSIFEYLLLKSVTAY